MKIISFGFLGFSRDRRNADCDRYHVTVELEGADPMKLVRVFLDEEVLDMEIDALSHNYEEVVMDFNVMSDRFEYPDVNRLMNLLLKEALK